MNLSEDLNWRGLIKDKTFGDNAWLDEPKTFYLGVDASSDSLTIGNLAVILLARRLADTGWKTVLLAGGATSLVGDPGGKNEERQLGDTNKIESNVKAVSQQIEKLFAGQPHEMVNNLDWLGGVKYLDFLRDTGKYYSMTELMQRDFVSARMNEGGSGISYAEFSYSLLQGYDFWWLFKNKGVQLQIGASDQWGNMLSGVPLIRKKESEEVHAMSMPLVINKATGVKFGKSEEGAIWLDPTKTSPTQFYQFWINTDDSEVEEYLKIFTFLSKPEIEKIMGEHLQDTKARRAQKVLAEEVTKIVHGDKGGSADSVTQYLIGEKSIGEADEQDLSQIRSEIGSAKSSANGSIIEALVFAGLAASNSDARRLLDSNAVYINNASVSRLNFEGSDFKNGRLILRRGKAFRDSALVELE